MGNPSMMRDRESGGHLRRYVESIFDTYLTLYHALAQSLAFDELGGDEMPSIDLSDFIYGQDVGVILRRSRSRFLLETAQAVIFRLQKRRQQFQRNLAPQPRVFGQINFTHASGAKLSADRIVIKLAANQRFRPFVCE